MAGLRTLERNDVAGVDHEAVLMRVEGEDQVVDGDGAAALLDSSDAAVSVLEGVAERSPERPDRLVDRHVRVEQAAVGEHLRASTDA